MLNGANMITSNSTEKLIQIKQILIMLIVIVGVSIYLYSEYDNAVTENERATDIARQRYSELKDKVDAKEASLNKDLSTLNENHRKEIEYEKTKRDIFIASVRNGSIRLSIPVNSCNRVANSTDPAPGQSDRHETRAELTPAAGSALTAIADEGDEAIRNHNACVDAYNLVRDRYNVQAR
jgi:prophage endopeptidase